MDIKFEEQIKRLSDIAAAENIIAQLAVDEVTKLLQTKYPELRAEYSVSDGGIIFINDSTMAEYYSFEQVYSELRSIKKWERTKEQQREMGKFQSVKKISSQLYVCK